MESSDLDIVVSGVVTNPKYPWGKVLTLSKMLKWRDSSMYEWLVLLVTPGAD